jgi:hypothetical protein
VLIESQRPKRTHSISRRKDIMRYRLFCTSGVFTLATLTFSIGSVNAQTTAVGPYYATPSWDQKIACSSPTDCPRFVVLSNWNSQAVLDRETGLVWERSPRATLFSWADSHVQCIISTLGARQGWRLPTLQEFLSLRTPSVTGAIGIALPSGHPFLLPTVVTSFWSATSVAPVTGRAYTVQIRGESHGVSYLTKDIAQHVWCVRSGQGVDSQ